MAKIRLAKKNAAGKTITATAADWSRAIPCLFFLVAGFLIIILLMYFAVASSGK